MSDIQGTVRMKIHDGGLEEFKAAARRCVEIVRSRDPGTLQYEWFFNADQTECVVRERYRDSEALLQHAANVAEPAAILMEVSDFEVEFFGEPNEELIEALAAFQPRVYTKFLGID